MELAFLTPLLKDGADHVGRGIAINNERVLKLGLMKDQGCTDSVDEGLKCRFMFVFPMKPATFCTMCHESVEWGCEHAEVSNIHAVKIKKTKESK